MPLFYSKINKKSNDFFNAKKFNSSKKELTHKYKSSDNFSLEHSHFFGGDALDASLKLVYANPCFGEAEISGNKGGDLKASAKFKKWVKGATFTTEAALNKKGLSNTLKGEYSQGSVAVDGSVKNINTTPVVSVAGAFGASGFTGGFSACYSSDAAKGGLTAYDVAAQYKHGKSLFGLSSGNKFGVYNLTVSHALSGATAYGKIATAFKKADADADAEAAGAWNTTAAAGLALPLDKDTSFKVKADTAGVVSSKLTHSLANPSLELSLSANYQVLQKTGDGLTINSASGAPTSVGFGITVGDY